MATDPVTGGAGWRAEDGDRICPTRVASWDLELDGERTVAGREATVVRGE